MPLPESIDELAPGIYADSETYSKIYINPLEVAKQQGLDTDEVSLFNLYALLVKDFADENTTVTLIDEQEDITYDNV